jgi:transposase
LGCDREQTFLLPPSLDEWLPPDHFARFVIAAVEAMDLSAFYGDYRADGHGRPAHDPAMIVALLMYAYARGERSSRAIERGCFEDIAMRFIAANRQPDHDDRAVSSAPRARDRGVVRTGPRPLRLRRPGNEHQIVVAAEVSVSSADFGQMAPMIDKARAELTAAGVDEQPGVVLADAGYWHGEQIDAQDQRHGAEAGTWRRITRETVGPRSVSRAGGAGSGRELHRARPNSRRGSWAAKSDERLYSAFLVEAPIPGTERLPV